MLLTLVDVKQLNSAKQDSYEKFNFSSLQFLVAS